MKYQSLLAALLALSLQAQTETPPAPPTPSEPAMPSPQATPPAAQAAGVPLYQITVVQGSAKAINYRYMKSSTKVDFKGTVLLPNATGVAKVKSGAGATTIKAKFEGLPPASQFGSEYLTYVLWGISPEGQASNLGEIIAPKGKGKLKVTENLQAFAMLVTAEPYFAVTQPSDAVVMENAVRKDTLGQVEVVDAKLDLLKRGQYTLNVNAPAEPTVMEKGTPFAVYQARNAVTIAGAAGAAAYATDTFAKAKEQLAQAEVKEGGEKVRASAARAAVQSAEDARMIAVKRQETERLDTERKLAQQKIEEAKEQALVAAAAQAKADAERGSAIKETENLRAQLMDQLNSVLKTRASARGLIVNMSGVLFHTGKADLLPAAREKLSKVAGIVMAHKGLKLESEGFTDSTGTEEINQELSEKRAAAARDFLISQGVPADAIVSRGFGIANPIDSNKTASGRQNNRRVELVVSGQGITQPAETP